MRGEKKGHEDTCLNDYKMGRGKESGRVDQVCRCRVGRMKIWDLPIWGRLWDSRVPTRQFSGSHCESESGTWKMKLGRDY